jgi:hypothetical protein
MSTYIAGEEQVDNLVNYLRVLAKATGYRTDHGYFERDAQYPFSWVAFSSRSYNALRRSTSS